MKYNYNKISDFRELEKFFRRQGIFSLADFPLVKCKRFQYGRKQTESISLSLLIKQLNKGKARNNYRAIEIERGKPDCFFKSRNFLDDDYHTVYKSSISPFLVTLQIASKTPCRQ